MKATEQYFPVVLFIRMYKVVLTFKNVKILPKYDPEVPAIEFSILLYKTSVPMEPKEPRIESTHWIYILILLAPIKRHLRSPYLDTNSGKTRRTRRSVSTEKNVEILMVADKTMHEFYKDGLEEYLLTIANMVCY